jgi:hypothetical protein
MKFILHCTVATLIGTLIGIAYSQTGIPFDVTKPLDNQPSRIEIKGGVSGTWLVVGRANKSDPEGRGFDPSWTWLLSDFKPTVKKRSDGKYLIQFTCDICEGIP